MEPPKASAIVHAGDEIVVTEMELSSETNYVNVRVFCSEPALSIVIRMDPSASCVQAAKQACSWMQSRIFQQCGKPVLLDPKGSYWLNISELSDTDTLGDVVCRSIGHTISIMLRPTTISGLRDVATSKEDCDVPYLCIGDLLKEAEALNSPATISAATAHSNSPQELDRQIEELRADVLAAHVIAKQAVVTSKQAMATSRQAIATSRRAMARADAQQNEIKQLKEDLQVHAQILNTIQLLWIMPETNPATSVEPQRV